MTSSHTAPAPAVHATEPGHKSSTGYNVAIGYLRAFVTVLVLAHHAVLAYLPFLPPAPASFSARPLWWTAFPVVDSRRWAGFIAFVGFNDVYFMSLMFFLSGLFVWPSLRRKGSRTFLRDRSLRLGLPFVLAAALVAPLAYYPAYLRTGADPSPAGFARAWLSLGEWPAGPAWFLWVLLAFDSFAAALFAFLPRWGETLGRLALGASRRPAACFGILIAVSAAAYLPMALAFSPIAWFHVGPFYAQTSRLLHYAVYFFVGVGVGAYGTGRGLLAPDGNLARRWAVWLFAVLPTFALAVIVAFRGIAPGRSPQVGGVLGDLAFVVLCAASSFACLAVFVRFARSRVRALDSLRDNAYGMYLIHYAFVNWLQYALLGTQVSAIAKGAIVFLGTLALSWGGTAALRRIPAVARVI